MFINFLKLYPFYSLKGTHVFEGKHISFSCVLFFCDTVYIEKIDAEVQNFALKNLIYDIEQKTLKIRLKTCTVIQIHETAFILCPSKMSYCSFLCQSKSYLSDI